MTPLLRLLPFIAALLLICVPVAQAQEAVLKGKDVTAEALIDALALPEAGAPRTRGLKPVSPDARPSAAAAGGRANLLITFLTNSTTLTAEAEGIVATLAKAMQSHEWINPRVVETYLKDSISWEDDQPFYKAEDGKLVALGDGVKLIAQTMPELLKSHGAGGSGYRSGSNGASQADTHAMLDPRAIYQARAKVAEQPA